MKKHTIGVMIYIKHTIGIMIYINKINGLHNSDPRKQLHIEPQRSISHKST